MDSNLHGLGRQPGVAQAHEPGFADVAGGAGGEVDPGLVEDPQPQRALGLPGLLGQVRPKIEQGEDTGLGRNIWNAAVVQEPGEAAVGVAQASRSWW